MDDVHTTRAIEDFLINPTYPNSAMEQDPGPAVLRPDSHVSAASPPGNMYSWKMHSKNAHLPATSTLNPFAWQGYASEEELASPVDTDDMSLRSPSSVSLASIASEESLAELVEKTCLDAEQHCNEAQAVRVVVAGKAKVVSMPKLIDDASRKKQRPTSIAPMQPVSSKDSSDAASQTSSLSSRRNSPRSSAEDSPWSPASTAPSSVDADEPPPVRAKSTLRRRPSLPQLTTTLSQPAAPMPSTAHVRQTVDFWERQPTTQIVDRRQSMPMSPGLRKLHKFSSSLAMNIFKKDGKQVPRGNSIMEESEEMPKAPEIPSASAGKPKPKMVARGANERAPPLVLPPCPEEYGEDDMARRMAQLPNRKDSCSTAASVEQSADLRKLHRRQRSISLVIAAGRA